MLKSILSFLVMICLTAFSIAQTNVTIKGYAPAYVNTIIEAYKIQDYLTMKEELIASTTVKSDSSFAFSLPLASSQKIILKSKKNKAYLYVQPKANYEVLFPEKDKYDPFRPSGNTVEITFFSLDTNDINYKILGFNRWVDDFVGNYYYSKNSKPIEFSKELDLFKSNAEKAYKNDTNTYFKTYVRFTFASMDEIQNVGSRNKYEKHDFYLKHTPVSYENDAYMMYMTKFYENLMQRLNLETSSKVNLAIEKSSPTLVMKALSGEYTLINLRIREIVMIKLMAEEFYKGPEYQKNILTILDSVSIHALFKNDQIIAKNTIIRLLELVPGTKSPDFKFVAVDGSIVNLNTYNGKHIYLHFFNPKSDNCLKELPVLTQLNEKYKNSIQIVTVYPKVKNLSIDAQKSIDLISWSKFEVNENDPIFKQFSVESFPYYVLIDQIGYIVSAPALGPIGQYETIDKTFYFIQDINSKKN